MCVLFTFDASFSFVVPLPASEAHKYTAAKLKEEISNGKVLRVHGQRLRGEMILTIEDPVEPTASAMNQIPPSLAEKDKVAKETDPLLS